MQIYTDFYDLIHDGFHRVIEFRVTQGKHGDLKEQLAFASDDTEKLNLIKKESVSFKLHTPTFGGEFLHGKRV
jgi:hypothetical protein